VSTAVQLDAEARCDTVPVTATRIAAEGKFLRAGDERFLVKGVTYGTFAPDAQGYQFPPARQIAEDFRLMAGLGLNTVRLYTPPRRELVDEAARNGLRVMIGLPWSQHIAFLDSRGLRRTIRREILGRVRELGDHPAVLMFALGNEIPPGVVRWHGRVRVERFLRGLYHEAKDASPGSLFTYVNFPPTEFLDLSFFDVCAFNVYLHRERELRAYLARLQHIAGHKPLLLAEAGADSIREGDGGQADITAMHIRAAFEEGACGAVAFAWTDEWWRGGHPVEDWAFGLVDRARVPKPAAAAVAAAFADAPFPPDARRSWPKVSVVVCAYNAESTIDDCLSSLDRLTYPDYEVILVNDGSRDRTSEIGRQHPRVRVIDTPNGGLSAARNVGLKEAAGEIVAYTDADVRVDRDWLTFIVQPLLGSDLVGSGGPNVVPADDPPMAQCIARAPGGPTHVLLDDRIAEHVPGCNMAFRRDALVAIGGFNPIYRRAGDDVDVCWRLQARGGKIGFASSALVWHHHRSTVKAYWRQQVGYGEGERYLMAHHPEKFLDGRMLWRGRIYSPLPFVRSLWGARVNSGVWGTAAFPSVYRTDKHPFAFLPHSVKWQAISLLLTLLGLIVVDQPQRHRWAAAMLLGTGLIGILATIAKNVTYALRSDVGSLAGSRLWYGAVVAYLHFIQPFARFAGQVRGVLSPPEVKLPVALRQTSRGPQPSLREARRALLLLSGSVAEDRFWSETWTTADRVLVQLTDWLRRSRAVRHIEIDDGWSDDRDVSVLVGRWAWLDARALVEDHGAGKSLLRLSTHLRPTSLGIVSVMALAAALLAAAATGLALRSPMAGATAAILAVAVTAFTAWRTAQTTAILHRGVEAVTGRLGMTQLKGGPARVPLIAPSMLRTYGLRGAAVFLVMILALGAGAVVLREAVNPQVIGARKGFAGDNGPAVDAWLDTPGGIEVASNGDVFFADSNNHVIRRIDGVNNTITTVVGNNRLGPGFSGDRGPATKAQLDTPDGVAITPRGDLIVADSHNDRIRRVDRSTGVITTIAGSGGSEFNDDKPALEAALNTPSAVAAAPNGDIYIADTLNYRIRMIDHATGLIHTIAGDGRPGDDASVGDGGPATMAHLNMPSDVEIGPNGDIYIADMHHQRVRRVDAKTHVISTVAGSGHWGHTGDGGKATDASLAGPAGIAVAPDSSGRVTIFIADYYNGSVRAVSPDGLIRDVGSEYRRTFGEPTRVAFAPKRGKLWIADSSQDQLVALTLRRPAAPPPSPPRRIAPVSAPLPARRIAPVSPPLPGPPPAPDIAPVSAPLPDPKRVGG
jgi:GT2 family glycosyltransferase/DNA-binding beta-propeller fold protein YncE